MQCSCRHWKLSCVSVYLKCDVIRNGKKSLMKITSFLLGWRRCVLLSNTENPIFGTHIRSPSPLSSLPGREAERTSESDRRAHISVKHNNNKALQKQSNNNFCVNPYIGKRQGKKVFFLSSYFFWSIIVPSNPVTYCISWVIHTI